MGWLTGALSASVLPVRRCRRRVMAASRSLFVIPFPARDAGRGSGSGVARRLSVPRGLRDLSQLTVTSVETGRILVDGVFDHLLSVAVASGWLYRVGNQSLVVDLLTLDRDQRTVTFLMSGYPEVPDFLVAGASFPFFHRIWEPDLVESVLDVTLGWVRTDFEPSDDRGHARCEICHEAIGPRYLRRGYRLTTEEDEGFEADPWFCEKDYRRNRA